MELIICPACNQQTSYQAGICTLCGYPIPRSVFTASTESQRHSYFLLGIVFLILGLAVYLATWFFVFPLILPAGRYPVIVAAIPALPLAWLAWVFFSKAGVREGAGEDVSHLKLYVIAFVIVMLGIWILAEIGVLG